MFFLRGRHGTDFATAAGVDRVELRGDDCGWDCWDGRWRGFVGEKVGGEGALKGAGVGVAGYGGEVEVAEEHFYGLLR